MKRLPPSENYHHNVPSSRGGTGQPRNLSPVRARRHADFHEQWASNKTPCALLRQLAIRSAGIDGGRSLPPDVLKELLFVLSPEDWSHLYEPTTTIWTHGVPRVERRRRRDVRENTERHLCEEREDVRRTIRSLLYGARSPSQYDGSEDMLRNALLFFKTHFPHEAMQKLLTETHAGQLSWVKAIQENVREELLSVLNEVQSISLQYPDKKKVADTLEWHNEYIDHLFLVEESR